MAHSTKGVALPAASIRTENGALQFRYGASQMNLPHILSNRPNARRSTKESGQNAQVPAQNCRENRAGKQLSTKPRPEVLGISASASCAHQTDAGVSQAEPFQFRQATENCQASAGDFGFRQVQFAQCRESREVLQALVGHGAAG